MSFIYVDGSYHPNTNQASIGISCKNLALKINAKDSLEIEIIAIIRGILLAQEYDTICSDCLVVVLAIKNRRYLARHEKICGHLFAVLDIHKTKTVKWVKRTHPGIRKANNLARDILKGPR